MTTFLFLFSFGRRRIQKILVIKQV